MCGNKNTIVAFQILDSRRTFTYARTPAEAFPDFEYDSCLRLNTFNQSTTYQFTIHDRQSFHPRHCLALCQKYGQIYALINNGECLCTNSPVKADESNVELLNGQACSQQCAGNYFYSCGNQQNLTIYSMYVFQPKCRHGKETGSQALPIAICWSPSFLLFPLGFEVAENEQQCVYSHFSAKTSTLAAAQSYCQSLNGTLASINDIEEIQDILPDSILHTRLMQQLLVFYKFKFVNDTRYYWIDRTEEKPDSTSISERLLKQCSKMPELIDRNCIAIQYVQNNEQNKISHERCIAESNECSTQAAMPVCIDRRLDSKPELVPPITDDQPAQVSVNISLDYLCNDGTRQYHFIDDYCYRISFHEVGWNEAKVECQRDQAMVFVPEKSVTLQHIKSLFLRHPSYTASGLAHVGVYYDYARQSVLQYGLADGQPFLTVPDSNAVYDLCEKTFQERYAALSASTSLTFSEKSRLNKQQSGCAYIDLVSNTVPTIRCDEVPCNRTATVICQKSPQIRTGFVKAKR